MLNLRRKINHIQEKIRSDEPRSRKRKVRSDKEEEEEKQEKPGKKPARPEMEQEDRPEKDHLDHEYDEECAGGGLDHEHLGRDRPLSEPHAAQLELDPPTDMKFLPEDGEHPAREVLGRHHAPNSLNSLSQSLGDQPHGSGERGHLLPAPSRPPTHLKSLNPGKQRPNYREHAAAPAPPCPDP